jgi:putative heme iron utilization protein
MSFSNLHTREYKRATSIYNQAGMDEEEVWLQVKSILADAVRQDMEDLAKAYQITLKDVFRLLRQRCGKIVPKMHFQSVLLQFMRP